MRRYVTAQDLLAIHWDQIERYGGSHGVRDLGLLQSALFRPQSGYYADLIEECAALWESLAQNHPSFDGNKRTAFAAVYTFLRINGAELRADADEAFAFISLLYDRGEFKYKHLEAWLRVNVKFPAGQPK
ncbi:MAG: type II toxin-antitoxin system death-on-curing family toxin [Acidobacteria bacterium]|nr:type II toxin-antitoxin system death-on-curing family toxin [Acidobacteriota bacterium]